MCDTLLWSTKCGSVDHCAFLKKNHFHMCFQDDDEDEKDKGDAADGAAKTKKKKKKKKKAAEEGGTTGQVTGELFIRKKSWLFCISTLIFSYRTFSNRFMPVCSVKAEEPEKEAAPAAPAKKQPPVQENTAAVQPVKAAAAEVSTAKTTEHIAERLRRDRWFVFILSSAEEVNNLIVVVIVLICLPTGESRAASKGQQTPETPCHTSATEAN